MRVFHFLLSVTLWFALIPRLTAQSSIDTLSILVGPTIDAVEWEQFGLQGLTLLSVKGKEIDSLQLFKRSGEGYILLTYKKNQEIERALLSSQSRSLLKSKIEQKGSKFLKAWNQIGESLTEGETPTVSIVTDKGTQFVVEVKAQTQSKLIIENEFGQVILDAEDIRSLSILNTEEVVAFGKYEFPNPSPTRYLFAPSAIPLKKGEGYYQNVLLTVSSLNYGLTDYLAISFGTELGSLLASIFISDFSVIPLYGNVKWATQVGDKWHVGGGLLGAGALGSGVLGQGTSGGIGLAYGLGTYGNEEHNLTLGLGWSLINGQVSALPVITVGGMTRINRKLGLVTENWIIPTRFDNTYMAFSAGARLLSKSTSIDLALVVVGSTSDFGTSFFPVPLPFLGLTYSFD